MESYYVFLCGVMWCKFGQQDAGKELVRAADSADADIEALARAMLAKGLRRLRESEEETHSPFRPMLSAVPLAARTKLPFFPAEAAKFSSNMFFVAKTAKLRIRKRCIPGILQPRIQFTPEEVPMSYNKLTLILALLCATAVLGQSAPKSAHADIVNAQGQKIGTARILAAKDGVKMEVNVSQLPPGPHGIHIHNVGKCEGPDFTSAGPHLNPYAKHHGKDNPEGPHAGDLLNIEVKADGTAKATLRDTIVTLGDGPNSIFHDGGTALVIHAKEDDYKTDPAGNSGPRIACGVIEK